MTTWRQSAIKRIEQGAVFQFARTFHEDDTEIFGNITCDYNPVHYLPEFAAAKGFPGTICHGLLVGSMICEWGGQVAWLASGMSFRFLRPVLHGDSVTCTIRVVSVNKKGFATAEALMVNQDGAEVMRAALEGFLPNEADRLLLGRMVAAGDPTNKRRAANGIAKRRRKRID